jgi:hypothetical protein
MMLCGNFAHAAGGLYRAGLTKSINWDLLGENRSIGDLDPAIPIF